VADVEQGYLVLADVSGFTGYLAGIELEHASGILGGLIQEMLDGLSPPFELAEVEGDAVFVHGPADVVDRGETLLEVIESTYGRFRRRRDVMAARTTCTCGACSRIDTLDLKFVTHFGDFAWQSLAGRRTPVGSDVNLTHRLLKNGVEAETGWRGYALFTDTALTRLRGAPGTQPPPAGRNGPPQHEQEYGTSMAKVTAELVRTLRERTGAGMMDCKRALDDADGDIEKAVLLLRERGLSAAAGKSSREAREGLIGSYIHTGGRVGVLIEVSCETDFVARTEEFQKLVRDLAVQVAGLAPAYVDVDGIPDEELEHKKAELAADPATAAKPAEIRNRIVEGQLNKWYREVVLYEQPFRDEERSVRDLVNERIVMTGENIVVRRFTRYALGEDQ